MNDNIPPRPTGDPTPAPIPAAPTRASGAGRRPPQTVAWLGTLGFLGITGALFLGLSPVNDCGSPWSPDYTAADSDHNVDSVTRAMTGRAQTDDDPHAACTEAFGNRSPIALTLLALGGISTIAALNARHREQTHTSPTPDSSAGPTAGTA